MFFFLTCLEEDLKWASFMVARISTSSGGYPLRSRKEKDAPTGASVVSMSVASATVNRVSHPGTTGLVTSSPALSLPFTVYSPPILATAPSAGVAVLGGAGAHVTGVQQ